MKDWSDVTLAEVLCVYADNSFGGELMREASRRLVAHVLATTDAKKATKELDPDMIETTDANGNVSITSERP